MKTKIVLKILSWTDTVVASVLILMTILFLFLSLCHRRRLLLFFNSQKSIIIKIQKLRGFSFLSLFIFIRIVIIHFNCILIWNDITSWTSKPSQDNIHTYMLWYGGFYLSQEVSFYYCFNNIRCCFVVLNDQMSKVNCRSGKICKQKKSTNNYFNWNKNERYKEMSVNAWLLSGKSFPLYCILILSPSTTQKKAPFSMAVYFHIINQTHSNKLNCVQWN